MFNEEGTLIFSTTPPRCSEKCVTVTLLLFGSDAGSAFASGAVTDEDDDMSKTGDAGGVLNVIRAAAVLAVVVGVLGECGDDKFINGPTADMSPLRFRVNLSPPCDDDLIVVVAGSQEGEQNKQDRKHYKQIINMK